MPTINPRRCDVPPADYGSPGWKNDCRPLAEAFERRQDPETAAANADDYLWRHADTADLRALGFCRRCGSAITLRQTGRCVYSVPCDHYRAQGDLKNILRFLTARTEKITDERRTALLALIGR